MSGLLWEKGDSAPAAQVQRFLCGDDVVLDRMLFLHDIRASLAHVAGLGRIGVLGPDEESLLAQALGELADAFRSGAFVLDDRFEDGHSAIEFFLVERLGDVAKKVHTGRSRNDQVLVALRLYLREALVELDGQSRAIAGELLVLARADALTPMPGYTHLQRAVPSSVGLWLGGFAEAFIDNAELLRLTRHWIDRSPLGTAAGYGVNLPLDREGVAQALGFPALQLNPMYAQNSRGKFELQALMACAQLLLDLRRLSWDLSLFTSAEFAFVRLPDRYTTGSSIMPNKRNPDVVELLRAAYAVVAGAFTEVQEVLSLPSGYHRDLQGTKGPLLRGVEHTKRALSLVPDLIRGLDFDRQRMRDAITRDLFATDRVIDLSRAGVPFRQAYRQVAGELGDQGIDQTNDHKNDHRIVQATHATSEAATPEGSLRARVSPGAPGDLRLDTLQARLDLLGEAAASGPR